MGVSLLEETEINQPSTMKMKGLAVLLLALGITEAQLKFGGSSSSSNSGSSSSSSSGSQDTSTDTRFFGLTSGNEAIDGGIVGVGAGLLGGALLSGALNGGGNNNNYNSNYNNPCNTGKDKLMVTTRTLVCLDCLVVTIMAVTVEEGGGGARLQERTELVSGSSVWKISWEEEITAAVTVATTNTLRITPPATTTPATTTPATT